MCRNPLERSCVLHHLPGFSYQPNGCILISASGELQFEICQALLVSSAHVWIPRLFRVMHTIFPPAKDAHGYRNKEENFPFLGSVVRKKSTAWFH